MPHEIIGQTRPTSQAVKKEIVFHNRCCGWSIYLRIRQSPQWELWNLAIPECLKGLHIGHILWFELRFFSWNNWEGYGFGIENARPNDIVALSHTSMVQ